MRPLPLAPLAALLLSSVHAHPLLRRKHHAALAQMQILQQSETCSIGAWRCESNTLQACDAGVWTNIFHCAEDHHCVAEEPFHNCVTSEELARYALEKRLQPSMEDRPTRRAEPADLALPGVVWNSPAARPVIGNDWTFTTVDLPGPSSSPSTGGSLGVANDVPIHPQPKMKLSPDYGVVSDFQAPHNVIYADLWWNDRNRFPTAAELGDYNRLILHIYLAKGPWDNVNMWTKLSDTERQAILNDYHAHGKAVMVSLFGSQEQPTTWNMNPWDYAAQVATFCKQYKFDGVDVDYEDFQAFGEGKSIAWLTTFQSELRRQLGTGYLISHAPIAPWFAKASYSDGGYAALNEAVGDGIDFYNVQYYNQGDNYMDCESIVHNSSRTGFPGTSISEINKQQGISLSKLVLGKTINAQEAVHGGYMDLAQLSTCVRQARELGLGAGGVMFWQWTSALDPVRALSTVLGK